MVVLHVDMDAFFAAIEERDSPQFQGMPVVVGADPRNGRGVVSTANYEARKYGIKSAMPISWAYRACPTAVFLPVDMRRYAKVSKNIMSILGQYAQVAEQVSVDEAYLELNNELGVKDYGVAREIAQKIKEKIWEQESLSCSIGIGPNKLISKIASDHKKPDGLTVVYPENAQEFLGLKKVNVLPGIGPKTNTILKNKWNIETIKDLRNISKEELIKTFGKNGTWIWNIARGIDERPIGKPRETKSIGKQTTFLKDTNDSVVITQSIFKLLEEIFKELKERNINGKTLTVVVRFSGFETHTSQETIQEELDFKKAKSLVLKLLLPYLGKKRKIRLVGVRISGF